MSTGRKIKDYIDSKGISQSFVSKKSGIPLPKLNLSLNDNRRLTFDEYETICWVLGVGVEKFLEPKPPAKKCER